MKKILIVSPHFPPSNLAAVHRSRLFAQHLPAFNWEPILLTVDERFYEEKLDWKLYNLLPERLRIEKVSAFSVSKPRLIGDIGIRAFLPLYRRAKQLIIQDQIDFLYIPIPSFYCALLGRLLHRSTAIKYGIDYIDPWVHYFPGAERIFSRHWISTKLAKILEPVAVKKASLITGVAEGYYKGVQERNPALIKNCVFGAMPYGGEASDHESVRQMSAKSYLFQKKYNSIQLVYAGAMLPKAYKVLEAVFASIARNLPEFEDVELHFIGTGKTPDDKLGYNIKPLAERYNLWEKIVFEYPSRIPYLDVLAHLESADGIFIQGSTEPHYTPSKAYQGVLAKKPILALLHSASTALEMLKKTNAAITFGFDGENEIEKIDRGFVDVFKAYRRFLTNFKPGQIQDQEFEQYSANAVTKKLAALLEKAVSLK